MNKNSYLVETKVKFSKKVNFYQFDRNYLFVYQENLYTTIGCSNDLRKTIESKDSFGLNHKYNAINISTGELAYFEDDTEVTPIYFQFPNDKKQWKPELNIYSRYINIAMTISVILIINCIIIGLLHILPIWFFIKIIIFISLNILMGGFAFSVYIDSLDK